MLDVCCKIKERLRFRQKSLLALCKEFASDKKGRSYQAVGRAFRKLEKDGWHLATLEKYTGIKKPHHNLLGSFGMDADLVKRWSLATGRDLGDWAEQHGFTVNMIHTVLGGSRDTATYAPLVKALQQDVLPWERSTLSAQMIKHRQRIAIINRILRVPAVNKKTNN